MSAISSFFLKKKIWYNKYIPSDTGIDGTKQIIKFLKEMGLNGINRTNKFNFFVHACASIYASFFLLRPVGKLYQNTGSCQGGSSLWCLGMQEPQIPPGGGECHFKKKSAPKANSLSEKSKGLRYGTYERPVLAWF